ncbi:MAG: TonB-dependent receptor [Bacteroidales bacterium]|nr:TonB-dependent receptor [Bacteroidales bacterium]
MKLNKPFTHSLIHLLTYVLLVFHASWAYAIHPYGANEQWDSITRLIDLESVSIQAVRANEKTPVSFSSMNKTDIQQLNVATNIPVLLQLMPSVVTTTENGTALGNTSFRIRGVDASRINVTINGLPLNNPASQEVFWVNLPNLAGFLNSVQVQRGVGTSTNGSSAFGASVNLETNKISPTPGVDVSATGGNFKTFGTNISVNSGLLSNGFFAEGNVSKINSDGYIRNGKINHQSAYFSAGLVKPKHFLKFNYLYGNQKTGITWEGATLEQIAEDRRFNPSGYMYSDENGNPVYYGNETDNYFSHIFQAFYVFNFSENWTFNAGFNYTNGFGYYERFRTNRRFSEFGLPNYSETIDRCDMVQQNLMRNDFYASNVNFLYSKNDLNVNIGGHYNRYDGNHFGELKWVKFSQDIPKDFEWFRNTFERSEVSFFTKFDYTFLNRFHAFIDLQYRHITADINGNDNNLRRPYALNFSENYTFFNPKIGLSFHPDIHQKWYVSVSNASREPTRADIKEVLRSDWNEDVAKTRMVKPEHLTNYEFGYQINKTQWAFGSNVFFMNYKDQLVPNGLVNESGYTLMDNIAKSYRLGIELIGGYQICKPLRIDANLTLSQNKIQDYLEIHPVYDNPDWWTLLRYDTTPITSGNLVYSPNVVGSGMLTYSPIPNLSIMLTGKYVGKQYFQNLSLPENRLEAYFVSDLSIHYEQPLQKGNGKFYVQGVVHNLFNKDYINNAFFGGYFEDGTDSRFFAQAPIHFSIKLGFKL